VRDGGDGDVAFQTLHFSSEKVNQLVEDSFVEEGKLRHGGALSRVLQQLAVTNRQEDRLMVATRFPVLEKDAAASSI